MNECVIVILSKYYLIKRETKVFGLVFSHLSFLSASWISLHHFVSLLLIHFFFYADLYNFQLFLSVIIIARSLILFFWVFVV